MSVLAIGAARVKRRIAEDPPRADYVSRTYTRSRRANPELLLVSLAEAPEPIDDRAPRLIALGAELERDDAYEAAMLRAFERAAGAVQANAGHEIQSRLDEVFRLRGRASDTLRETVAVARELSERFTVAEFDISPQLRIGLSGSLDQILPDDVLAALYRSGIAISNVRRVRVRDVRQTVAQEFVSALAAAANELQRYSNALAEWDPEQDARRIGDATLPIAARPVAATFEIYSDDEGRYRWRLRDRAGRVLAIAGESYETRLAARLAVQQLEQDVRDAPLLDE